MSTDSSSRYFWAGWALLALAGCATTSIRSVESDPTFHADQVKRVMVINLSPDPKVRSLVEDEFVRQWKKRKIDAVASYQVLPAGIKIEKGPVAVEARGQKFDSVLVTRLSSAQRIQTDTSQDNFDVTPGTAAFTQAIIASPQYSEHYRMASVTTRLYQVEGEKKVWTTVTETLVTEDVAKLIEPFVKTVLETLYTNR